MQLVFFIVYTFEALIAFMYFNDNFKLKKGYLYTTGVVISLYALGFVANIIDKNTNYINGIVFIVINIAFSLLCFDVKLKGAMFHSAILYSVMVLTEVVAEMASTYIMNIPIDAYRNSLYVLIILAIVSKLLYLMVCRIISFFFSYKNEKGNNSIVLFIFPVIIATLHTFMLNLSTEYGFTDSQNMLLAITSIISLFFCGFIFIYNRHIQNQQQELFELQQQSLKNEIDMQYLNLLEKKNQQMQILTHDYKNHLYALQNMSGSEQAEYIERISAELKDSRTTCHSGNRTLDIILNKYVTECELKGISFNFDVKISNLNFVSDYDLVSILGNLLDNALEAAQQSEAKTITFKTNKINTYDSVIITNSCDTPPDKNLKTTKQNKKLHGIGLKSVAKTLKKYGGELEWDYNTETKEFTATVILLTN